MEPYHRKYEPFQIDTVLADNSVISFKCMQLHKGVTVTNECDKSITIAFGGSLLITC